MSESSSKMPCRGCPTAKMPLSRRDFLRLGSVGLSLLALDLPVMAGPFEKADFDKLVPADKKLNPDWVKSLFERGTPAVYRGGELAYIGMPVGGLCTGQLYLGGDGKLWNWDIFNHLYNSGCGGARYLKPVEPDFPLEQGFSLEIISGGTPGTHSLDAHGFSDISFRGEYPIGKVTYADPQVPVMVELEAFSPFIPLSWDDSSLPATVLRFTVKNPSASPVELNLSGSLQNGAAMYTAQSLQVVPTNRVVAGDGFTFLECSAVAGTENSDPGVVFEDWSKPAFAGWTVEGNAFGTGPVVRKDVGKIGDVFPRIVSSQASGLPVSNRKDVKIGKLTSQPFSITKNFIQFWIGGGNHHELGPGFTTLNLLANGKVVRTTTGDNTGLLALASFDVRDLRGQQAQIEIANPENPGWGDITVGPISFNDNKPIPLALEKLPDFGTMGLALLGAPAERSAAGSVSSDGKAPIGTLGRTLRLEPGASGQVDFVLSWYFPNLLLFPFRVQVGRSYGKKFDSALAVTRQVAANFDRLAQQTRLWRDTWYDSTLPYWFLDRTFLNASTLASSTSYRFASGRFYGWEGVGSCAGTCTHVWHYAQAPARLFPELERAAREMNDYEPSVGFVEANGSIGYRGEFQKEIQADGKRERSWAADGQAGCILRVYREHQMSADNAFLLRLWPRVKQSMQFLMSRDTDGDGLLDGPQHNTLDSDWFGKVAWLSGLYAASLRAAEEMARDAGDPAFAEDCRAAFEKSAKSLITLFDGDYFVNRVDPAHLNAINSGTGCEIDQVLGQSWAWQVGLGRIFPEKETRQALQSLWRYNFTPDAGAYRALNKPGRWYATAGEAGLIMCTFPRSDWSFQQASGTGSTTFAGYFNECMNGFEHQAAGHMIAEGEVQEGLAVIRAVHDRYHPSKRNPWNELECGDHYARSMASYGVFIAACGYEHHGPKGHLGFAPRLTPEDFRAPFTAAEGWGTYFQKIEGKSFRAGVLLRYGSLRLNTLAFALPADAAPTSIQVMADGVAVPTTHQQSGQRLEIALNHEVKIAAGGKLDITIA